MNAAAKEFEPRAFLPPPDAEQVEICLKSGELASDDCYEVVEKGNGISSQVRCTYIEYLRPGTDLEHVCSIHGKAGGRMNSLSQQKPKNGLIVPQFVVRETAVAVFPIGPTITSEDDPYNSIAPIIRARVATVVEEPEEEKEEGEEAEEVGSNGLIIARPLINETEDEELPAQRVEIPRPRAIEFD